MSIKIFQKSATLVEAAVLSNVKETWPPRET